MVVLSIIIILASMGLAQYRNSIVRANEAVLKEDLFRMRDAIDQYYADKGQYPTSLDALASEGYLRKMPDDPFTKSSSIVAGRAGRTRPQQSQRQLRRLRRQERIGCASRSTARSTRTGNRYRPRVALPTHKIDTGAECE